MSRSETELALVQGKPLGFQGGWFALRASISVAFPLACDDFSNMSFRLATFCLLVVFASVGGGLVPLVRVVTHIRMQVYLSFSAGVMLGSALLHMLPESAEIGGPQVIVWSLPGLLTLFMVERFFSYHHHEFEEPGGEPADDHTHHHEHAHDHSHDHSKHSHAQEKPISGRYHWKAAATGLALHSLLGGVALASAEAASSGQSDWSMASGVFLATLLHKPADALTITSLMKRGRTGSMLAHLVNLVFALMIPLGAILFQVGQLWLTMLPSHSIQSVTGAALAFSAGTFLCISLSDLLPELHFHSHDRVKLSIALIAGILLMSLVAFVGD